MKCHFLIIASLLFVLGCSSANKEPRSDSETSNQPESVQDLAEARRQLADLHYEIKEDKQGHVIQLILCEQDAVTDETLRVVKHLPHLQELNLIYDPISGTGLRHLSSAADLRHLDLYGTRVDEKAFEHIVRLEKLSYLNLQTIDHDSNGIATGEAPKIGDEGLAKIAKLQNLETLLVSGVFTDEGLKNLAKLKNLRFLEIDSPNISQAGMEWLQRELPELQFDW